MQHKLMHYISEASLEYNGTALGVASNQPDAWQPFSFCQHGHAPEQKAPLKRNGTITQLALPQPPPFSQRESKLSNLIQLGHLQNVHSQSPKFVLFITHENITFPPNFFRSMGGRSVRKKGRGFDCTVAATILTFCTLPCGRPCRWIFNLCHN